MMVLPITAIRDINYKDFVRSGCDYDEPAIVPPLAGHKDYEKIKDYTRIWSFAETILKESTELVIIGCSIRPEDIKFNELLLTSLNQRISITVVDRNPDYVIDNLRKLLGNSLNIKTSYTSFTDYAKTL